MSLANMRCDRCGELEECLFRAKPMGDPDPIGWYCEGCMKETGTELDPVTKHLTEILRRRKRRHEG